MPQQYPDIDALLRDAKASISRFDALSASTRGPAAAPVRPRAAAPVAEPQDDSLWGKIKRFGHSSYLPEDIGEQFIDSVDPQDARDRKAARGEYTGWDTAKSAAANVLGGFMGAVRETNTPFGLATLPGGAGSKGIRAAAGVGSALLGAEGAEAALDDSRTGGERAFGGLQTVLGGLGVAGSRVPRPKAPAPRTGAGARGEFSPFDAPEPPPPVPPSNDPLPVSRFAGDGRAQPIAESIVPPTGPQPERWTPNLGTPRPELPPVAGADPIPPVFERYTPNVGVARPELPPVEGATPFPPVVERYAPNISSAVANTPAVAPQTDLARLLGVDPPPSTPRMEWDGQRWTSGAPAPDAPPSAQFAFHQDDFEGGSIPLYHLRGGANHGSTVSVETLRNMGIDIPDTPDFVPQSASHGRPKLAAPDVAAMLSGRQKFADANPGVTLAPGVRDELDRAGVEYTRTQRELKRLLGMPDADPAEVSRMQQGARELGSRLRRGAKDAVAPPPAPDIPPAAVTPPPSSLKEMLEASIAEQDAARAARDIATPPAPRGEHFRLPETHVPDETYNQIREHIAHVPPSPLARATRDAGSALPESPKGSGLSDRFTREFGPALGDETGSVDPRLLASMLRIPAGAAIGAYFDDDHRARGATIGAGLGAASMLAPKASLEGYRKYQGAAMLSRPATLAKVLAGNVSGGVIRAAEQSFADGSMTPLKRMLSELSNVRRMAREGKDAFDNPEANARFAEQYPQEGVLSIPGRIIGATDAGPRHAMERAGMSADDALRVTMQAEPETEVFRSLLAAQRRHESLQTAFPFVKTGFNLLEQGLIDPVQGAGRLARGEGSRMDAAKLASMLGIGAAGAVASDEMSELPLPLQGIAHAAAGPYAVPGVLGRAIGSAIDRGQKPSQAFDSIGNELSYQVPFMEGVDIRRSALMRRAVPGIAQDAAHLIDPVERDTSSFFGPLLARLPFLSKTLPRKKTARSKYRED